MMKSRRKKINQTAAFQTILVNQVEVVYNGIIIGHGLAYYDGVAMLKPDIVSLTGGCLPVETYLLRFTDDPRLAILPENVQ